MSKHLSTFLNGASLFKKCVKFPQSSRGRVVRKRVMTAAGCQEEEIQDVGHKVWRTYDDGYIVRSMSLEDANIVHNWYLATMRTVSRYALPIALSVYPPHCPGFYIGEYNGEVVASAVRIPWGNSIMFGSLYYVVQAYRGLGFGTRIRDEVAKEHVGGRMVCSDVMAGKVCSDNISKHSYTMGYECYRFAGLARDDYPALISDLYVNQPVRILQASEVDFEKLIRFDNECFVSQDFPIRREFLQYWFNIPDGETYVAVDRSGEVLGYGSRHPAVLEGEHIIGPLYCKSAGVAERIMARLCAGVAGQMVCLKTSAKNKAAVEVARRLGLKEVHRTNRMHLNGDPKESRDNVYAFTSLHICGF